jgi:Pretoxin HINT domain
MSNDKDPNRELAKQRLNMGKDPGGYYSDTSKKYQQQQAQKHQAQKSVGSGGGSGCFPSGTIISTPSGGQNIASIQSGDYVSSVDIGTGEIAACRVLSVRRHSARNIWRITFEDGHQVRTTSVHSFRVVNGWKKASRVCPGDKVLFYDARGAAQVKNVRDSCSDRECEDVFNLIVENHFNFVADGALVHSFTYLRAVRVIAWRILTVCCLQTTGALEKAGV